MCNDCKERSVHPLFRRTIEQWKKSKENVPGPPKRLKKLYLCHRHPRWVIGLSILCFLLILLGFTVFFTKSLPTKVEALLTSLPEGYQQHFQTWPSENQEDNRDEQTELIAWVR